MTNIGEQKAELRKQVAAQAKRFTEAYLRQSDEDIGARLRAAPEVERAGTLFCYVSVGAEPDTRAFIGQMLEAGKTVVVPRCLKDGIMEARRITSFGGLNPAPFGLLEPGEDAPLVDPAGIDVVVAPCVAAAEDCGRLGHGAGYYDRFLTRTACPVLCLCRGELLQKSVPMDGYDRYMDAVITEDGVWRRGKKR